ncbi:MAG: hypothetical protein U5K33_08410 [Halofilum sp. (in: g-proteobacteria)]|nr:hypothetical protein [Halofilum sp. (in: g-proteobacteria)]
MQHHPVHRHLARQQRQHPHPQLGPLQRGEGARLEALGIGQPGRTELEADPGKHGDAELALDDELPSRVRLDLLGRDPLQGGGIDQHQGDDNGERQQHHERRHADQDAFGPGCHSSSPPDSVALAH